MEGQIVPGDGELLQLGLRQITGRPSAFSVEQLVAVLWSAAILQWPLPRGAAAILVRHVLDSPTLADTQVRWCPSPSSPPARRDSAHALKGFRKLGRQVASSSRKGRHEVNSTAVSDGAVKCVARV